MLRALGLSILLHLLAACAPAEEHGPDPAGLAIPELTQERLLCVPTAAAMVLAFYGDPQPPRRLKALSRGQDYAPGAPFGDYSITPFRDQIAGLQRIGYHWSERTYPNTPYGFVTGIAIIEAELAAGRPVLVDLTLGAVGHTVVVRGVDLDRRAIHLVDPEPTSPRRRTLSYDQFAAVWNERAYGGDFRAMILTRPKPNG